MYLMVKRVTDVCVAGTILIFFSPMWVVLMIILRLTGEGEIFFKQKRIGYNNKEFLIWKFATMLKDSPSSGTITAENDTRILPLGRFLRKTKMNELPQLLNVLTGEMSIVGPRPLTKEAFNLYPEELKPFVYQSKVGITGVGSIIFRNEEQILANSGKEVRQCYEEDIMPVKGALEVWYNQNISFMTDAKIIILTAITIIKSDNALHVRWFKDIPVGQENVDISILS